MRRTQRVEGPSVLGVDPGFSSFGWAVLGVDGAVHGMGVLRTKPTPKKVRVLASDDNVRRTRELVRELRSVLERPGRRVCLVAAESMSFPRSSSVAAKVAMAWGVIVSLAEVRDLPLLQASPQEVKRRVVGHKTASKAEVEAAMVDRFGEDLDRRFLTGVPEGEYEHAFDALAVAAGCLDSEEARLLRAMR